MYMLQVLYILVFVMLQLLYIWYIMAFVSKDKIRTSCVLYMLGVRHLDIMCVVHVSHVWCYYSYTLELFIDP